MFLFLLDSGLTLAVGQGEEREATVKTAKTRHDLSFQYKKKLLDFRPNMSREKVCTPRSNSPVLPPTTRLPRK